MTIRISACLVGLLLAATVAAGSPSWNLDLEAGMVQASRNDIRIPGDSGTEFSFTDDLKTDDDVAFRVRLGRRLGHRGHLSILAAPLQLHAGGTTDFDIDFNDETFAAGSELEGLYQFNSYRMTWRYDLSRTDNLEFGLGVTAKVRDAFIELSDGTTTTRNDDLGFVPLVNLRLDWRWGDALGLLVEGDALVGPQGRAEDGLVALVLRPRKSGSLRLGYRVLEGGADVDTVYNFTLLQYYTFGWSQRF